MSKRLSRRDCLGAAGALTLLGLSGGLYAAPLSGPRFLLEFLRGGYDATNTLIPYSSHFYYEARPSLAIARPDVAVSSGALALDDTWALAPALRDSIGGLWQARGGGLVPLPGP